MGAPQNAKQLTERLTAVKATLDRLFDDLALLQHHAAGIRAAMLADGWSVNAASRHTEEVLGRIRKARAATGEAHELTEQAARTVEQTGVRMTTRFDADPAMRR